jgi:hypothetical protein
MSQFNPGQLGVASQLDYGQMGIGMPQFHQGHGKISAPLHPAIKQAQRFREYIRTPAGQSGPPPPTTFAWFLQRMNISRLGFSDYYKNVLRQYVKDFSTYEQTMVAGVRRVQ